jgi:erythromycin esterase
MPLLLFALVYSNALADRVAGPIDQHDTAAVAGWLTRRAVPLAAVEPVAQTDDLLPFATMVSSAKVVGLGEAHHGAHEFFTLKRRLVQFLVEKSDFSVFALEADLAACEEMNDYVLDGRGDPAKILSTVIGLVPWDTEEVLQTILWLRRWNADPQHARKVRFFGFDSQWPVVALQHVLAYLRQVDDHYRSAIEPRLAPLSSYPAAHAYSGLDAAKQHDVQTALKDLIDRFDASRESWSARSGAGAWARLRQIARTVQQAETGLRRAGGDDVERERNAYMAENLMWQLAQEPKARIVAWAHNGHLAFDTPEPMGALLKAQLGNAYFNVAFAFRRGAVRARRAAAEPGEGWRVFSVATAKNGSLESALARTGRPALLIDLRTAPPDGLVARWLDSPHPFRTGEGAVYDDRRPEMGLRSVAPRKSADAIAYVEEITPARPTPWGWQNHPDAQMVATPRNLDWTEGVLGAAPPGWSVKPGRAGEGVRIELVEGARALLVHRARAGDLQGFVTVQQDVRADAWVGRTVTLELGRVRPDANAWVWLRGETDGGALTLRKLAALEPAADGTVRFEAAVPAGTATLHFGISSLSAAVIRVGAFGFETVASAGAR